MYIYFGTLLICFFFFTSLNSYFVSCNNNNINYYYLLLFLFVCRLVPPSQLVDLPVRKGELNSTDLRHKSMEDRLLEFSLGPVRNIAHSK